MIDAKKTHALKSAATASFDGAEAGAATDDHSAADTPSAATPPHQAASSPKHSAPAHAAATTADATRTHRRHPLVIAVVVIVCVLAAGYLAAGYYFSSHFLPNTQVNGIDVSWMDEGQLKAAFDGQIASYSCKLTNADESFSVDVVGENIGLSSDTASSAAEAAGAFAGYRWLEQAFSAPSITVSQSASYEQDGLDALVRGAVEEYNQSATQPVGSHVAYDQASESFIASKASYGTALDADKVIAAAGTGVAGLEQAVTLDDDALLAPTETQSSEQVIAAASAANSMVQGDIPLTLNGDEVARLARADLASWISVDDAMNVTLDQDAIRTWADGTLSPAVNYSDATYDWKVNSDKLVPRLVAAIESGSTDAVAIPMYRELRVPDETPGAASLGRHIDVNLSTQYARFYDSDGSIIWESFIVSGNTSEGRGTPCGSFAINNKKTNITLVGADENHDGEPDYRSKVTYWMPFLGNSWGLHDASWRSRFGGDIYTYNGSHGCVNLPSDKAAELYGLVQIGDAVIIHT